MNAEYKTVQVDVTAHSVNTVCLKRKAFHRFLNAADFEDAKPGQTLNTKLYQGNTAISTRNVFSNWKYKDIL